MKEIYHKKLVQRTREGGSKGGEGGGGLKSLLESLICQK